MILGERIQYFRKRAGLSQEGLAERLGVSRQAVSKWETDEALPDAERIISLAVVLGVTTDALLLGREEPQSPAGETVSQPAPYPEWLEHLPRGLARLFREKGYIAGYLLAAYGLGPLLLGRLAHYGFSQMLPDGITQQLMGGLPAGFSLPLTFANIISLVGLLMIIGGLALALVWKRRVQK